MRRIRGFVAPEDVEALEALISPDRLRMDHARINVWLEEPGAPDHLRQQRKAVHTCNGSPADHVCAACVAEEEPERIRRAPPADPPEGYELPPY